MEQSNSQFLMEERKNGDTGVALFQTLPKPAKELVNDEALLISLLKANGFENIISFKLGEMIPETLHHCQKAIISFSPESAKEPIDVVIKFNRVGSPEAKASCAWREALFYARIAPEHLQSFAMPKLYLAMIEKASGQQFIITELIKEPVNGQTMLIKTFLGEDLTEIGGAKCNLMNYLISLSENLAVLHSNTFIGSNPELVSELEEHLISAQWMNGKGKDSYQQALDSVNMIHTKSTEHKNAINPADNQWSSLFKASIDKATFDALQANTKFSADGGTPYALTMHYYKREDAIWSKCSESVHCVDFEFIGYAPIVLDLVQALLGLPKDFITQFKEPMLKAYFAQLTKIGKIDTTVYTMERFQKEIDDLFISVQVVNFCKMNLTENNGTLILPTANFQINQNEQSITNENILPACFSHVQVIGKDKADDFEIQMETRPDGTQKFKVRQPMPFSLNQSMNDEDLIKKLLIAYGMSDLESIELQGKDDDNSGMSQETNIALCIKKDGSKLKLFLKANKANGVANQWREALFFSEIYVSEGMDAFRAAYPVPLPYFVMVDEKQARQFIMMECLDDSINYGKIFACNNGNYVEFKGKNQVSDRPVEEVCGVGVTKIMTYKAIAGNLAALHYFHWNDKSLFEKFPYLMKCEWYQGKNEEGYLASVNQQASVMSPAFQETHVFTKTYPELSACFQASIEKAKSFENFQNCYVKDPTVSFTLTHGDSHERQAMWSASKKTANIMDYELVGFNPAISDLCYMINALRFHDKTIDPEEILKHYYEKLTSFGEKVTKESYTYDQMHSEYVRFYLPKVLYICVALQLFLPEGKIAAFISLSNEHMKKYNITPENVEPMINFL